MRLAEALVPDDVVTSERHTLAHSQPVKLEPAEQLTTTLRAGHHPLREDLEHVLNHTRSLWEELRRERIFITGGTGFFGCWLLDSFLWANDRLGLGASATVLTRDPERFRKKAPHLAEHGAVSLHAGDVRSFRFPEGRFSNFIHAGNEASARMIAENPLLMLETIVEGTRHALDFAVACGARRFLLTSSGAVYGTQPSELRFVPETHIGSPDPTDPYSAYGEGKRAAELLCAIYSRQHGLEAKIARCFAFVGPNLPLDTHFAIGNFIRDSMNGGPILVKGDGSPFRSYLYAADLAIWLWTILLKGVPMRAYNVGSDRDINIAGLAQLIAGMTSPPLDMRISRPHVPGTTAERYVPSTSRARCELGLSETISLEEAIKKTIHWNTHHR